MNRIILIGNAGQDAKRFGTTTTISLATSAGKDKTDWHQCKCFGKTAELAANITKGQKIAVEGRLSYNTFEKDGQKRTFAEVLVDRIEFMTPKGAGQSPDNDIPF